MKDTVPYATLVGSRPAAYRQNRLACTAELQQMTRFGATRGVTMPLRLIFTTISNVAIHMRLADDHDPTQAAHWIDFRLPVAALKVEKVNGDAEMEPIAKRHLATIWEAAFRCAQDALGEEIRRAKIK
jgi:hypothetical protein